MRSLFLKNCLTALCIFYSLLAAAQGDLLITPKRLVFDGTRRSEEINLANIGKDTSTYSISFAQFRMDDKGTFVPVPDDDTTQKFAHKNLRFFPRTVTLAPNEAQSVKVQLLRANELSPGEYRSHLLFKNVPEPGALGDQKNGPVNDAGISVNIKPVFGISIATIIRVGPTSVTAAISNPQFTPPKQAADPSLAFVLTRSGNISVYGDLSVKYISPDNKSTEVAVMKGVAVYTPNALRQVQLGLRRLPGIDYSTGKLHIQFTDPATRNSIICEAEHNL